MLERIQKIISAAGITSRRAAEQLILEGRVRVNGQVVTELGTKADPSKDHIKVDGKLINPRQPQTYIMLNKPAGFVTTMSDPEGRPTVQHLLQGVKVRVYPVGRLDYNTEGMLILTNDGDFAHLITHPKHELPKTYLVKVKGVLDEKQIESLESGIFLDDGKTAPAKIKKVRKEEANSWVEITIHEGRKRQVRRMFDRIGRSVIKLKRIRTGALVLGDLPEGTYRHLSSEEVQALREMALKTDTKAPSLAAGHRAAHEAVKRTPRIETERKLVIIKAPSEGAKRSHRGKTPDLRPWRMDERAQSRDRQRPEQRPRGRTGSFVSRGEGRGGKSYPATRRPFPGASHDRPVSGADARSAEKPRRPYQGTGQGRTVGEKAKGAPRQEGRSEGVTPRARTGSFVRGERQEGKRYPTTRRPFPGASHDRPVSGTDARSGEKPRRPYQGTGQGRTIDEKGKSAFSRGGRSEGPKSNQGPRFRSNAKASPFTSKGKSKRPGGRGTGSGANRRGPKR